jgi:protein tyrosine/serine phosphatase
VTPWTVIASFCCILSVAASCTGFHEVREGSVYRDRQPAEDELVQHIEEHGIRTVIVLRGENADTAPSRRATLATGTDYVAIPLSATNLPAPGQLLQLWGAIEHAQRPLLLHCRAGVDRTGLAAAIAVLHDTGDLDAARAQLALLPYGHLGWFGTGAMDEVIERYAPWHGTMSFPDWVRGIYARQFAGEQAPAAPQEP